MLNGTFAKIEVRYLSAKSSVLNLAKRTGLIRLLCQMVWFRKFLKVHITVQGCQVWPFRGRKNKFGLFFNWLASKLFRIYCVVGLFKVYRSLYCLIRNFLFLKAEFGIFFYSFKDLATLSQLTIPTCGS